MRSVMLKPFGRVVLAVFWTASLVAISPATAAENANSNVFPVQAKPHGQSYGEWSARQ